MDINWIPDSCTLPSADRPRRAAEFDDLLAQSRGVERVARDRLRFDFDPDPAVAKWAAELAVRETACCMFFTFTLTADADRLRFEVAVPPDRTEILDGWTAS